MRLIMPELRYLGNFSDLSKLLFFFFRIFSKLLLSCTFVLLLTRSMLALFETLMRMFCNFRRRFLVRVVLTVVIIPCAVVYITLFCRVHFIEGQGNFYETGA